MAIGQQVTGHIAVEVLQQAYNGLLAAQAHGGAGATTLNAFVRAAREGWDLLGKVFPEDDTENLTELTIKVLSDDEEQAIRDEMDRLYREANGIPEPDDGDIDPAGQIRPPAPTAADTAVPPPEPPPYRLPDDCALPSRSGFRGWLTGRIAGRYGNQDLRALASAIGVSAGMSDPAEVIADRIIVATGGDPEALRRFLPA